MAITLDEVRRHILIALVSDDELMNVLVLKGGNALALVHEVGNRASVDIDFSIEEHFSDLADTKARIFRSLRREFKTLGYALFDEQFLPKPSEKNPGQPDWWGGYYVEFKLIELTEFERLRGDSEAMRRRAAVLGPQQKRKYTIDISKNEYCAAKVKKEIDDYVIYVYSLEMIAIEKLRALCQQMPSYELTRGRPRPRDFYDIYSIAKQDNVDLCSADNRTLLEQIFAAKRVSPDLLDQIHEHREFHRADWPAVTVSISGPQESFDFYFDYVVELASKLKALRKV